MTLDHEKQAPFEVIDSSESARDFNLALRRDRVRWPDGQEADYRSVEGPSAVFVVPYGPSRNETFFWVIICWATRALTWGSLLSFWYTNRTRCLTPWTAIPPLRLAQSSQRS